MNLNDYEVREEREIYGNDTRAINRHSVRCYRVPGNTVKIFLDKTLDASPPCYELYTFDMGVVIANIPVNGKRFFGDGLTWGQAIKVAGEAIEAWFVACS